MKFEAIMVCLKFDFLFLNICGSSNGIPVSVKGREVCGFCAAIRSKTLLNGFNLFVVLFSLLSLYGGLGWRSG
jgi:hypothetical protein